MGATKSHENSRKIQGHGPAFLYFFRVFFVLIRGHPHFAAGKKRLHFVKYSLLKFIRCLFFLLRGRQELIQCRHHTGGLWLRSFDLELKPFLFNSPESIGTKGT